MTQATLIAHCGAMKVTLEELRRIPTPDTTATYRPVPHIQLVETIQSRLDRYGIAFPAIPEVGISGKEILDIDMKDIIPVF